MKPHVTIGGLQLGDDYPTRIMGIINVSPESFFKGSVYASKGELQRIAERMALEGADVLDVGARSTAPYLETDISTDEEIERISNAIEQIKQVTDLPISADTFIGEVADAARQAGATILNDVSGLAHDKRLTTAATKFDGLILMANANYTQATGEPVAVVSRALQEALDRAATAAIDPQKIILDPGIGFFRNQHISWDAWDRLILQNLETFRSFNYPLMTSVSRKSFIGKVLGHSDPHERLYGSLAVTAHAVQQRVHLIRTHDVLAARDAARMIDWLR